MQTESEVLLNLARALDIAVTDRLMSVEHAAVIWKLWLKILKFDLIKKEVKTDGSFKED